MKMNKQFEEWFKKKQFEHDCITIDVGFFYALPFSFQWGVYLEFFDEKDIIISIEFSDIPWEVYIDYQDVGKYDTRQEAQREAIKKAFEILEN